MKYQIGVMYIEAACTVLISPYGAKYIIANPNPTITINFNNHTPSLKIFEVWLRRETTIVSMKCIKAKLKNHLKLIYSLTHTAPFI